MDKSNQKSTYTAILSAYQTNFINSFLKKSSPQFQVLAAPYGTGKTTVAFALIEKIITSSKKKRILILTYNHALAQLFAHKLEKLDIIPVINLDRSRFREIAANVPPKNNPWAEAVIVITTMATAIHNDVMDSFLKTEWDLVLADEFNEIPRDNLDIFEKLITISLTKRILLISDLSYKIEDQSVIDNFVQTEWKVESFYQNILVKKSLIQFERGSDEIDFLLNLNKLISADSFLNFKESGIIRRLIEQKTSSSLMTLEDTIHSLRKKFDHNEHAFIESQNLVNRKETQKYINKMTVDLNHLINGLDQVHSDTKLEALSSFLVGQSFIKRQIVHVCIFSSFKKTISYLYTALQEEFQNVYKVDASLNLEVVDDFLDQFDINGGILLLSDASLKGIEINKTDALIHYDLPSKSELTYIRISRFREKPSLEHAFIDISGVWPYEINCLKINGFTTSAVM